MNIENIERVKALMVEVDRMGAEFDMGLYRMFRKGVPDFYEPITVTRSVECGAVCCALGYMSLCLDHSLGTSWQRYFGISDGSSQIYLFLFLFGTGWAVCPWPEGRTSLAVNKRLDYLVKFGVDHVVKLMAEKTVQNYEDLWPLVLAGLEGTNDGRTA